MTGRVSDAGTKSEGGQLDELSSDDNSDLDPVTILRIEDNSGRILEDWTETQSKPIVSPQLAYLTMNILSDEAARWPELGHPNPLEIGRPAAVKWGSTPDKYDAWTVGYIPQFGVGVWIGSQSGGEVSPDIAAALWHALVQYAAQDLPSVNWNLPPGIISTDVCDPSGLLPTEICPTIVNEIYLPGNEPTEMDNLYRSFQINRETGRLASAFTPPELVDERVYLLLPPQALQWAEQAGLPIPPASYDLMVSPPPKSSDVGIVDPVLFAHVHGKVNIVGSAAGIFATYRLLVGQGVNPQTWIQIGDDEKSPVVNELLGVWEVDNLSGLYTLQLQVIYKDQRV
jgi:membrane carboxypeptidase/penicillin-binding protein PbpC